MADIVKLNVGGVLYTTTKSTITAYPDSMLGAMFSGSMPTTIDNDGNYFIDRDGNMFIYILNFLRSSTLALPVDFKHYDQLSLEADFYQIVPLIGAIQAYKTMNYSTDNAGIALTLTKSPQNYNIRLISKGGVLKRLGKVFSMKGIEKLDDQCVVEREIRDNYRVVWNQVIDYLCNNRGKLLCIETRKHESEQTWLLPQDFL